MMAGKEGQRRAKTVQDEARSCHHDNLAAKDVVGGGVPRVDDRSWSPRMKYEPSGRCIGWQRRVCSPALVALVTLRAEFIDRLQACIRDWSEPARAAWIFGSAARADGDRQSDVDIVAVSRREPSEIWEQQIGALVQLTRDITGNAAQVLDYSTARLRELVRSANPIIGSLRADGIELVEGSDRLLEQPR